jgi:transcriptional regulator with XRE-family HTH domain
MQITPSPANGGDADSELLEEIVSFGRALRFYRDRAKLTQVELADRVHMRSTTLSNWEGRAEPPADFYAISEIAKVLGVDTADLMAGRIRRPKISPSEIDVISDLATALARKHPHISAEEILEILSGFIALGEDERRHVRMQIGLLRRIPPSLPPDPTDTPNDAGGRA